MKKKTTKAAVEVVEAPVQNLEVELLTKECAQLRVTIQKLEQTNAEYKKAFETVKLKLQTIYNITQL